MTIPRILSIRIAPDLGAGACGCRESPPLEDLVYDGAIPPAAAAVAPSGVHAYGRYPVES